MNSTMTYEKLYTNMVKKFTVEKDNTDYKLGEYMLMKARAKKEAALTAVSAQKSALPVLRGRKDTTAIAAIFSYVNDKLTVKEAPIRDKTIRSFPFRTSIAAFCSALVVCALVVSCSIFGFGTTFSSTDNTVNATEMQDDSIEQETENEIPVTYED